MSLVNWKDLQEELQKRDDLVKKLTTLVDDLERRVYFLEHKPPYIHPRNRVIGDSTVRFGK